MSFQLSNWPLPANVMAGWTTREGGVSSGVYSGLNVGKHVGDLTSNVMLNRSILKRQLKNVERIVWLNQTHSIVVCEVSDANPTLAQDACFTRQARLACCVMTADCLPVYFWDQQGDQVAVAHAGWRGLADGVLIETLRSFDIGSNVSCGFGPCIGSTKFEVTEELLGLFSDFDNAQNYFKAKSLDSGVEDSKRKYLADLVGLAESQLRQFGVKRFYYSNECTASQPISYFSHRRDGKTGRMANVIWKISAT